MKTTDIKAMAAALAGITGAPSITEGNDANDAVVYGQGNAKKKSKKGEKEIEIQVHEDAEELEELSKDTLRRYATKAHRQGDMAARMSNNGTKDDMNKIANKRFSGVQKAINKMSEEAEELDELSKKTLGSYVSKATSDNDDRKQKVMSPFRIKDIDKNTKMHQKYLKRKKSIATANKKMGEAVELDELSKKTLGSYVKKSLRSAASAGYKMNDKDQETRLKGSDTLGKRMTGVDRAAKRLAKEETQLDELSKKTLGSYIKAASQDRGTAGLETGFSGEGTRERKASLERMKKRQRGIKKAVDKITKESTFLDLYKEMVKENIQLDELSKGTLGAYVKSAARDMAYAKSTMDSKPFTKAGDQAIDRVVKRKKGISKAVDKLTKEGYAIKHKSGSTLSHHDSHEEAQDHFEGLGKDKADHKIVKTSKKAKDWSMKEALASVNEKMGFEHVPQQPAHTITAPAEIRQAHEPSKTPDTSRLAHHTADPAHDGHHAIAHNKAQEKKNVGVRESIQVTIKEKKRPYNTRVALEMMMENDRAAHYAGAAPPEGISDKWSGEALNFVNTHELDEPGEVDINVAIEKNKAEVDASLRRSVQYRHNDSQIGDKKPVGNDNK